MTLPRTEGNVHHVADWQEQIACRQRRAQRAEDERRRDEAKRISRARLDRVLGPFDPDPTGGNAA